VPSSGFMPVQSSRTASGSLGNTGSEEPEARGAEASAPSPLGGVVQIWARDTVASLVLWPHLPGVHGEALADPRSPSPASPSAA
jgi:hypothetical protein